MFAFGPYSEQPWRIAPQVDFWPARVANIEVVQFGTDELTPETVAALLGASEKGFPVIEYLLFRPDSYDLMTTFPRQCDYLRAIAADLQTRADQMLQAWLPDSGGYLTQLVTAGQSSTEFATLAAGLSFFAPRPPRDVPRDAWSVTYGALD